MWVIDFICARADVHWSQLRTLTVWKGFRNDPASICHGSTCTCIYLRAKPFHGEHACLKQCRHGRCCSEGWINEVMVIAVDVQQDLHCIEWRCSQNRVANAITIFWTCSKFQVKLHLLQLLLGKAFLAQSM